MHIEDSNKRRVRSEKLSGDLGQIKLDLCVQENGLVSKQGYLRNYLAKIIQNKP
jgi:hypothetical protein